MKMNIRIPLAGLLFIAIAFGSGYVVGDSGNDKDNNLIAQSPVDGIDCEHTPLYTFQTGQTGGSYICSALSTSTPVPPTATVSPTSTSNPTATFTPTTVPTPTPQPSPTATLVPPSPTATISPSAQLVRSGNWGYTVSGATVQPPVKVEVLSGTNVIQTAFENFSPYCAYGDPNNGSPCNVPSLNSGTYIVRATANTSSGVLTAQHTVVIGGITPTPVPPTPVPSATVSPTPSLSPTPGGNVIILSNVGPRFTLVAVSNITYRCAPGTVLDGGANPSTLTGGVAFVFTGNANNVTVENCEIRHYSTPVQEAALQARGDNWVFRNNHVHHNLRVGIQGTQGSQILNNNVHNNGQMGIKLVGSDSRPATGLVSGNEIGPNNGFLNNDGGVGEIGGTKFVRTVDLKVTNNHVFNNVRAGLWTDINNVRTLYEGNLVEGNGGMGIVHELSYDAIIRNNIVRDNGRENWSSSSKWLFGCNILIQNSEGLAAPIEVHNNTVVITRGNGSEPGGGICVIDQDRGESFSNITGYKWRARNVLIRDNIITGIEYNVFAIGFPDIARTGYPISQANIVYRDNLLNGVIKNPSIVPPATGGGGLKGK